METNTYISKISNANLIFYTARVEPVFPIFNSNKVDLRNRTSIDCCKLLYL